VVAGWHCGDKTVPYEQRARAYLGKALKDSQRGFKNQARIYYKKSYEDCQKAQSLGAKIDPKLFEALGVTIEAK
jgi:hypothetical protein